MSHIHTTTGGVEGTANPRAEVAAGMLAFCIWFALFAAGAFVGTKPYRDELAGEEATFGVKLQALTIVLLCYTATNTALLCCAASVLGGIFRRMRARQRQRLLAPSLLVLLLSLVFQGFVVYLVMASGIVSIGWREHFFDHPTREQYLRLAVTCSLISLTIGYSPGLFNGLMNHLERTIQAGIALQLRKPPVASSGNEERQPSETMRISEG